MNDEHIAVIGAGAWGTTIAQTLAPKFRRVRLWTHSRDILESIHGSRENRRYLPGIRLLPNLDVVTDCREAVEGCRLVFSAIPVQYLRERIRGFAPFIARGSILVNLGKGIEFGTHARPSEILLEEIGQLACAGSLVGPNIAAEVAHGMYAEACLALTEPQYLPEVQGSCATARFRVTASSDVVGIELAAAVKNVVAIAAGACDGLGLGINTKSVVIGLGLADLRAFLAAKGSAPSGGMDVSSLGDVLATCFSPSSRNRRFGESIAQGFLPDVAREMLGGRVAEGYSTSLACHQVAERLNLSLPVLDAVYQMLYLNEPAQQCLDRVLAR